VLQVKALFKATVVLLVSSFSLVAATVPVPILTVCDILQDLRAYNGRIVIVVGKASFTGEGTWLTASCSHTLKTAGHTWPNVIATSRATSLDDEPAPTIPPAFRWDDEMLRQKLATIVPATRLGGREYWMAVYGRLETRDPLPSVVAPDGSLAGGFGHLSGAPAQIVAIPKGFRRIK